MLHTITLLISLKGLIPPVSEAHCGCTSFHKYVITLYVSVTYNRIPTIPVNTTYNNICRTTIFFIAESAI